MNSSDTRKEFSEAFTQFQAEVTNPKMTAKNPYFNSKYSPLSDVLNTVRPILSKYGLSVSQDVASQEDKIAVTTIILHKSGEYIESSPLVLPAYQKLRDGRTEFNAQGAGSAITYAKRYSLQSILGIAADEDDDAEGQVHGPKPSKQNIATPTEATLKAKYQLVKGSLDGYESYIQSLKDKGHDNIYIVKALDKALEKKK